MATPFSRDLFCGARNLNQLWESDQKSNLSTISSRNDYNIMHSLSLKSALYVRPSYRLSFSQIGSVCPPIKLPTFKYLNIFLPSVFVCQPRPCHELR